MGILGKVTSDLEGARGPDVAMVVTVPREWFGREIVITLPRIMRCAVCQGGGCDQCLGAGAITLRASTEHALALPVVLPPVREDGRSVCIRIPEEGGQSAQSSLGRGHLLITVRCGDSPSPEATLRTLELTPSQRDRAYLMKRSLIMTAVLTLLFLGMLRLSGWL